MNAGLQKLRYHSPAVRHVSCMGGLVVIDQKHVDTALGRIRCVKVLTAALI
jgi:hypothetical protein